jgi:hypothetical protein
MRAEQQLEGLGRETACQVRALLAATMSAAC